MNERQLSFELCDARQGASEQVRDAGGQTVKRTGREKPADRAHPAPIAATSTRPPADVAMA
ncbi:hypothetical protein ASO17_24615 [Salmonella enterica subsp. enterica serovar Infantis]|nr:hypothetical protein ASO17_24615 [Salmonella enterica subsp. enterica serovar Infantis]